MNENDPDAALLRWWYEAFEEMDRLGTLSWCAFCGAEFRGFTAVVEHVEAEHQDEPYEGQPIWRTRPEPPN